MARTRLKVCCITSISEARIAIDCGADALGLVARMPSGPGVISDEEIARISSRVPPGVATFLLTSETGPSEVVEHVVRTGVSVVQLVDDDIASDVYMELRSSVPNVQIVQVMHIHDQQSVEKALRAAHHVDALLLDSGAPDATVRQLGGTGRTHNWSISRQVIEKSTRPVFLAGGLTPENVQSAIQATRPFGIDLCSGVRTDGRLDGDKLKRLVVAMNDCANHLDVSK